MEFIITARIDSIKLAVKHRPANIRRQNAASDLAPGITDNKFVVPDFNGFLLALLQEGFRFTRD